MSISPAIFNQNYAGCKIRIDIFSINLITASAEVNDHFNQWTCITNEKRKKYYVIKLLCVVFVVEFLSL